MRRRNNLAHVLFLVVSLVLVTFVISLFDNKEELPVTSYFVSSIEDNATIVFWSTRDVQSPNIFGPSNLYVMDKNGGNVNQITFVQEKYQHAAISPDRTSMITSRRDGVSGRGVVWLFDLQNQETLQLVPNFYKAGMGGVDWSIDNWIYFAGVEIDNGFGSSEVYRIRQDGTGLTQITSDSQISVLDVSVSEDGTLVTHVGIVIYQDPQGTQCGKPQIWVVDVDGSDHRMVDDGGQDCGMLGGFPLGDYDPEISPDNNYIIFSKTNPDVPPNFVSTLNTAHDIWIAPIDRSSAATRITQEGPASITPDWHNDKIIYTEYNEQEGYVGLTIINPDGTGKQRLEQHSDMWDGGRHGKWLLQVTTTSSSTTTTSVSTTTINAITSTSTSIGTTTIAPSIITNYYDGRTTDFADPGFNPSEESDIILEKTTFGIIRFNETIRFTQDRNLDSYSDISSNRVFINTSVMPEFNVPANITLYNLNLTNPRILRDGQPCSSDICTILDNNVNITFSVMGFTEYSAEEIPPETATTADGDGGGNRGTTTTIDNITTTAETTVETSISTTTTSTGTVIAEESKSKTSYIIAGIVIIVLIMAAVGDYLYRTKRLWFLEKKQVDQKETDPEYLKLKNAVQAALKQGNSKEAVRKAAIKQGWPKDLIDRLIK